ncbi:unnamed protein product, partial [Prorocentrum cordatum]
RPVLLLPGAGGACTLLAPPGAAGEGAGGGGGAALLEGVPAGSVGAALLLAPLPLPGTSSAVLFGALREVARALCPGGKMVLACRGAADDRQLRAVLGLPVLGFSVAVRCPDAGAGLWTYVCTRRGAAEPCGEEAAPAPGAVRAALGPGAAPGEREVSVWTRNPDEAAFEYAEMFKDRPLLRAPGRPRGLLGAAGCPGPRDGRGGRGHEPRPLRHLPAASGPAGARRDLPRLRAGPRVDRRPEPARRGRARGGPRRRPAASRLTGGGRHRAVRGQRPRGARLSDGSRGLRRRHGTIPLLLGSSANSALARHRPEARWAEGEVPDCVELDVACCRLSEALRAVLPAGSFGDALGLFLKVDVEGAELDVLRGLQDQDHWQRVCGLAAEVQGPERLAEARQLCAAEGGFREEELLTRGQPHGFGAPGAPPLAMLYASRRSS